MILEILHDMFLGHQRRVDRLKFHNTLAEIIVAIANSGLGGT